MILKSFWFWKLIILIGIQFIPMDVPEQIESNPQSELVAPQEVMAVLKRSCYDCHSNTVVYPWYDKIAPASWYAKGHVKKGRKHLNFSIWNDYNQEKKLKLLQRIPKSIVIRMPLSSYLWLHEEAKLSKKEKQIVSDWANSLKEAVK